MFKNDAGEIIRKARLLGKTQMSSQGVQRAVDRAKALILSREEARTPAARTTTVSRGDRARLTRWRWALAGLTVSAAAGIALFVSPRGREGAPPVPAPILSQEDVQRLVRREETAAQLLAMAAIFEQHSGGQEDAARERQLVLREYADTTAAKGIARMYSNPQGATQ